MARSNLSEFVSYCKQDYNTSQVTRAQLFEIKNKYGIAIPSKIWGFPVDGSRPIKFDIDKATESVAMPIEKAEISTEKTEKKSEDIVVPEIQNTSEDYSKYIPKQNKMFYSYGVNFNLINSIVKTSTFFPVYIWGVSGVGKTLQVEQACANHKRPFFRCQITKDSCNEDLIGSYSLINGNTVWVDGPILKAYKSGGILLLDEIDLNSSLMVLQVVLENKPIYIQQTGEMVYPNEGFNVFATGNTKGDGSDSRYVGTSVLNDAFLERFVTIVEQKIPTINQEKQIITKYMQNENITMDEPLFENFLKWIDMVRSSYSQGDIDIYLSSRRIQYILKIYKLTGNFGKSLELALARYSDEQSDALVKIWKAINN